jgi:hypothetical protein
VEWFFAMGKAYWIYMNEATVLDLEGEPAKGAISLKRGWNLVGYNSTTSMAAVRALSTINGKYSAVYAFDTDSDTYKGLIPAMVNELTTFEPGSGYWIYAIENTTWSLP